MGRVRDGLEDDHKFLRQLQRYQRLLAGRELDCLDGDFFEKLFKSCFGQIDPGAPENLPEIFPDRERVGVVCRDSPQARADRKGDFDHFVECRFAAGSAERAVVGLLVHGPERVGGIEHAATARTENVPGQLEPARAVQRAGNR